MDAKMSSERENNTITAADALKVSLESQDLSPELQSELEKLNKLRLGMGMPPISRADVLRGRAELEQLRIKQLKVNPRNYSVAEKPGSKAAIRRMRQMYGLGKGKRS
jgi:hypothetical protein